MLALSLDMLFVSHGLASAKSLKVQASNLSHQARDWNHQCGQVRLTEWFISRSLSPSPVWSLISNRCHLISQPPARLITRLSIVLFLAPSPEEEKARSETDGWLLDKDEHTAHCSETHLEGENKDSMAWLSSVQTPSCYIHQQNHGGHRQTMKQQKTSVDIQQCFDQTVTDPHAQKQKATDVMAEQP